MQAELLGLETETGDTVGHADPRGRWSELRAVGWHRAGGDTRQKDAGAARS